MVVGKGVEQCGVCVQVCGGGVCRWWWGREWKSVVCVSRCVEGEYVGGGGEGSGRVWCVCPGVWRGSM